MLIVKGEIQKNPKGFAFLLQKPEDFFISPELAQGLVTGDQVKAWVNPRNKQVLKIQVLEHTLKQFIGTFLDQGSKCSVVFRERTAEIHVPVERPAASLSIRPNDKVLVEVTQYEPMKAKIIQGFGEKLAPRLDTFSIVVRSGWPQKFSAQAEADAKRLSEQIQAEQKASNYRGRKDLRDKPFVTIDGADARDFDDAICVERTSAGFVLYVAIADVAEFVREGTMLDQEAYGRATSVYFPEWVIPMLPEVLSNGSCSLRPNEEKLTLTCEMHFDELGAKKSAKFYESVIESKRRCIYEDVQKEADSANPFWTTPYALFDLLRKRRFARGALDLELPEAKVILDAEGNTTDIKRLDRVDAHKLIEEFMIVANESVTEIMEREKWPFVYRIHEPPVADAMERFLGFASALGVKAHIDLSAKPRQFALFLETIKDKPYATTLSYMLLRSLKQARYENQNLKHFGLASKAYTHFTSPIRRYPDLIVHRLLKMHSRRQVLNEHFKRELNSKLAEQCEHCSKLERKAELLDRQVVKIKKARFMANYYGEIFSARVSNVSDAGIYVELDRFFVDGLVPIDQIGGDYFVFHEDRFMLRGKRTGRRFRIGDSVKVMLLKVDTENGFIDFTLPQEGEKKPNANRKN
jgi:ribonuclease R